MSAPMTREAALRIGLAARVLPGIEPKALASAIAGKYGLPISENTLSTITVADLKQLIQGDEVIPDTATESLKEAVRLLWGEGVAHSELPAAQPYAAGDMPGSIRVAIASNKQARLDGHFGSCERFLVYQVSSEEIRLIALRPTLEADAAEDRNAARADLIADCQLVYVQSIGGPAAAKVVRAGVHPVKTNQPSEAQDVLQQLRATLTSPPPWLARVMGIAPGSLARFAETTEEEAEA